MGFFSFRCAKSNESIPSLYVEPCEVTLFLKDGSKISGVYDGYGNIGQHDQALQKALFADEGFDIRYLGGKEEPEKNGSTNSIYTFVVDLIDPTGKAYPMESSCRDQAGLDVAQVFEQRKSRIITDLAYDLNQASLKIVKGKHLSESDTYESLGVSSSCPYQGYFYPEDYDWNVPHQFQDGNQEDFETESLDQDEDSFSGPRG